MPETPESAVHKIDQAIDTLIDHFDTVHIFCTRHDPAEADGTITVQKGRGNWYARYGQIVEWIVKMEEVTRAEARKSED